VDALVIASVNVLHSLLEFFQEWRAEGGLAVPREMAASHAWVLRDGRPTNRVREGRCAGKARSSAFLESLIFKDYSG
jgi:hypothetical protein